MEARMVSRSALDQAQRLRIYIGEADRWRGKPLYAALLDTLKAHNIAGATVVRGVAGFGAHSRIHTAAVLHLSEDLPLLIDVVDNPEKIAQALEVIYPMVREGLITLEDVRVIKYTHRYLNPLPADRLVEEVMTRQVVSLPVDLPIYAAWQRMLESELKSMPVVDEEGCVVGMLTDGDLLERAGIQERLAVAMRAEKSLINAELNALQTSTQQVRDVMSHPVVAARAKEPLGIAAARMAKQGLKRLPVIDVNGKPVGMLSRVDILQQVAENPHAVPSAPLPAEGHQTVRDVMVQPVPTVFQEDDQVRIVDRLLDAHSHRVIVVDDQGGAVGVISASDVVNRIEPAHQAGVIRALRRIGKPPAGKETAYDIMSKEPLTASPDLPLVEAARIMMNDHRKWLVVVDPDSRPLGLIDRRTLLNALVSYYGE
jgi:CBS-domain-containing membrane protein